MDIGLQPYQYDFVYSRARHPAFVGGWGVGKTLCAIGRSRLYSKGFKNNLGVIFRKTFRSLQDSTMNDFEKYTGLKIGSDRNFVDPNGSITMFRHIDELDSINQQNINLGWFYIEQGDELENSDAFFMLFGRLRRELEPTEEFKKLGLAERSGWVIANAGDHWMKPLWKENKLAEAQKDSGFEGLFSELIEATTLDNEKHLPKDFISSLKILEKENLPLYRQFVLNDWGVALKNKVFIHALMELMKERHSFLARHSFNIGVAVDPSGEGADPNVFMSGNGGDILEVFEKNTMSPTEKAIKAVQMCQQVNGFFIVVDCDGLGIETYAELVRLPANFLNGIQVLKFHGSAKSELLMLNRRMYENVRSEAAFVAQKRGWAGLASVNFEDRKLIEELEADEFFTNKSGFLQIIPKEDIKENLKRSPGRADCWKMLQWVFDKKLRDMRTGAQDDWRNRLPKEAIADDDALLMAGSRSLPKYVM